jgi:hypothetical protein
VARVSRPAVPRTSTSALAYTCTTAFSKTVAPVPVRSPDHAEGAPEPALSLPKGSLAFGDREWKADGPFILVSGTAPPSEHPLDPRVGRLHCHPAASSNETPPACAGSPGSSIHSCVAHLVYTRRSTTTARCPVACPERCRKPAPSLSKGLDSETAEKQSLQTRSKTLALGLHIISIRSLPIINSQKRTIGNKRARPCSETRAAIPRRSIQVFLFPVPCSLFPASNSFAVLYLQITRLLCSG